MTDDEYNNLNIDYGFYNTPVGNILIASSSRGICCIEFAENYENALQLLCNRFVKSNQRVNHTELHDLALQYFHTDKEMRPDDIVLHLYGTDFQISVWKALLDIPLGKTTTYSHIADAIENPRALRAVGTAIGKNPVAVLIPCHRVIRTDGCIGGYYWGINKKKELLEWEKTLR